MKTVATLIKEHNRFEELKSFYDTDDLLTISLNFMDDVNKYKRFGFEEPDIFDSLIEDIVSGKEMLFNANKYECEKILKEKLHTHFNNLLDGTVKINVYEDINIVVWELILDEEMIASHNYNLFNEAVSNQTFNCLMTYLMIQTEAS